MTLPRILRTRLRIDSRRWMAVSCFSILAADGFYRLVVVKAVPAKYVQDAYFAHSK